MLDLGALPFSVMSQKIGFFLFADDTNIFFSHDEVLLLEKTSDKEPLKLTSCWQVNKLSINYSQSKSMVFNPRQKW